MPTIITSNGSKWAGQAPDSIETLLDVLRREPLDRTFEKYGNFADRDDARNDGTWDFFGNFLNVSHVFNLTSDDLATVQTLVAAIRANQQRPDYLSQPETV